MTPDHCVWPPACWLIVERVSEPEPGKHWKQAAGQIGHAFAQALLIDVELLPVWAAIALAIEIASSKPSSAIAKLLLASKRTR